MSYSLKAYIYQTLINDTVIQSFTPSVKVLMGGADQIESYPAITIVESAGKTFSSPPTYHNFYYQVSVWSEADQQSIKVGVSRTPPIQLMEQVSDRVQKLLIYNNVNTNPTNDSSKPSNALIEWSELTQVHDLRDAQRRLSYKVHTFKFYCLY